MSETTSAPGANSVVIKKYANRRLYNTATSTYVTLDDLSSMVKAGTDFVVYDAKTGEDITRSVLTQIIFEEESKGTNLLPINFLRQLIRYYGDQMQAFVPGYLEFSLDNLTKDQDKLREQMMGAFTGDAFKGFGSIKGMEEQAKRNMAMFTEAMKMFNPFAAAMGGMGSVPVDQPQASASPSGGENGASKDELQALKEQLQSMQDKLNKLSG